MYLECHKHVNINQYYIHCVVEQFSIVAVGLLALTAFGYSFKVPLQPNLNTGRIWSLT